MCSVNLQHNCVDAKCGISQWKPICQECMQTSRTLATVDHKPTPEFFLNVYSIHNYAYIHDSLPEHHRVTLLQVPDVQGIRKEAVQKLQTKCSVTAGASTMSSETLIQPLAVSGEASTSRMQPALTGNATSLPVKKGRSKWQNIQAAQDASSSMPTHHLLSALLSQAPPVPPSLFATPIPTAIPMPYSHSPVFYHSPIPLMPQVPIIQNVPLHYQTMLHAPPPHI